MDLRNYEVSIVWIRSRRYNNQFDPVQLYRSQSGREVAKPMPGIGHAWKSRFHGTWWPLIRSRNCVVIAACRRPMHVIRERLTLIRNCLIYESIDFIVVKIHYPLYYKRFVLLLQAVPQIRNIDEVLNPNKFIYIEITYVSASHVHQTLIYEDGTNAILINKS